jgi:ferritin
VFKEFIDILEKDLRRVSEQSFIFEDISSEYKNKMIQIFKKAVHDELESVVLYKYLSEIIEHPVSDELQDHSEEEFSHFNKLIKYASTHGIIEYIDVNLSFSPVPSITTEDAVNKTQELETIAISDYKQASEIADEEGDTETKMFFIDLMKEEMEHYDDIQQMFSTEEYGVRNF